MDNFSEMFNFSSRLWYNKRRVSTKNGEATLYLQIIIGGKHKEHPLKLRWPVDKVDLDKGILLPRFKADPDLADYNLIIEIERSKHTEIFKNYRIRKEDLTIQKFFREISVFDTKECFLKFMELEAKRRFIRKEIDRKTFQNANATRKQIILFDNESLFKNIDLKWMTRFKNYLLNEGYKPSTVWSRIAYTKAYLKLASLEPMIYVNEQALAFPNPKPNYSTTFLDNEEIRRLMIIYRDRSLEDLKLRVLGAFLFTCFTSLRISDLYRVNARWQLREGFLNFIPKKNHKKGKEITIPIMPLANHFVQRITGKYFDLPTEQAYNRILKEIAGAADINKRLSSHTGRHTFGYLYMTTIGNLRGLQEILGHSKLETTERYAHLDEDYQRTAVKKIQDQFSDLVVRKIG